jgi:hypothetical protein
MSLADLALFASSVAVVVSLLSATLPIARGGIGDEYRSFLDGLVAESRHSVPPNLPNTLRQYITEEREALERSQDVRP